MVNHLEQLDQTFAALVDPTRHAIQGRANRNGAAVAGAHQRSHGLAAPLRALLVGQPRSAGGVCRGQGSRNAGEGWMTSLTIVRRIKTRPSVVFDALTTPEAIACWWGPDDGPVLLAETDLRVGGR